jgi:xanthine dehydrogenase accessory factor
MDANDMDKALKERLIIIRGAGEMATGVACSLYRANFRRILMLEIPFPLAIRRHVTFCEAVHEKCMTVEGIEAVRVFGESELKQAWTEGKIAVAVDPEGENILRYRPDLLVDAILAKRNLGISIADAPMVVALGPGFEAGRDCHVVVETNRGHDLGRLITAGTAEADTGIPGNIAGYRAERVVRAPTGGIFTTGKEIGDPVRKGEVIGTVGTAEVIANIDGILRGLIRPDSSVTMGLKIGDIDPRGEARYCDTVSEKARTVGGAVLEAMLAVYNV